ncbi:hypothetical protein Gotri_013077, partial [Gossypium trilobum]|nr:hypothetical protein [Gossypium trilobum]
MIPKDSIVVHMVQEFYASLWDQESRKAKRRSWET